MSVSINGTNGVTFNDGSVQNTSALTGFRNRIINGDMRIDQRNAGASVTPTDLSYTLDRWKCRLSQASKYTIQRNAGSVTPPTGFSNYLGLTVGASANVTIGTSDYFAIQQIVEGFNVSDLAWGTASAQAITLSFWVRGSVTGSFGGALQNSAENRGYGFTYSINSANTWEKKTITISGDTSGTWLTDNSIGAYVNFNLGSGSQYGNASNGSWSASGTVFTPTGQTSPISTNSATFYITGVQLEAGSTATDFERRPYGVELALCQRYYEKSYALATIVGTNTPTGLHQGVNTNDGNQVTGIRFIVSKRSAPATTVWSKGGTIASVSNTSYADGANAGSWNPSDISEFGFRCVVGTGGLTANTSWNYHYRAESEL